MIGNPILGTGFRGALNYIAQKDRAELLHTNMAGRSPRELAREFGLVRHLRPKLGKAVCHMFFRPAPGEALTPAEWREVLDRALAGMGFESSPYVAYMHRDAGTDHLHIVASRIAYDGSVVSDSHNWPRMMRISAEIERDFGLRIVARDGLVAAPKREESGRERRTGETSARARLVELADRAARAGGSVSDFVVRLRESGAETLPSITSTGRVSGISFGLDGLVFKGSDLGRAYSWPGLRRHFGLTYHPDLDQPALLAARAAAQRTGGRPGPPAGRPLEPPPEAPARALGEPHAPSVNSELARGQVAAHLSALGAPRYTLAVVDVGNASRQVRTGWTAEQVLDALGWLRHRNAAGADILIRPQTASARSTFVLTEVDPAVLARAERSGCQPAAVVRTGTGTCELWLRHPPAAPDLAARAAERVAEGLGLDAARSPSDYGHLAGFTVHEPDAPARGPGAPYASLESASGRQFEEAPGFLAAAAQEIATARELAEEAPAVDPPDPFLDAAVLYRDNPLGVPWVEPNPTALAEALSHLSPAEARLASAEEALLASSLASLPEREVAYEAASDAFRDARLAVCGHSAGCSPDLPPPDLARHGELVYRLENARADAFAEASGASRAAERRISYLEEEVSSFRRELGLAFPEEPPPGGLFASLDAAYRSAAGRVEELRAEPPTTALRASHPVTALRASAPVEDLRAAPRVDASALQSAVADRLRACQDLARHDERFARAFAQLEARRDQHVHRLLSLEERAAAPGVRGHGLSTADRTIYTRTVAELSKADASLRQLETRALEARGAALDRALDHLRPALAASPRPPLVERYLGLLERRHEVVAFRSGHLPPGDPAPSLHAAVETARSRLDGAVRQLLARPSPAAVAGLETASEACLIARSDLARATAGDELRKAQAELAGARADLASTRHGAPVERYAEAVSEVEAASVRLELLAPAPPYRGPQDSRDLLQRLRAGERSPALLQDLHRELLTSLAESRRSVAPAVDPSYRSPRSLGTAADRHLRAEQELARLVDRLSAGGRRLSAPELEACRTTVLRCQLATQDLHEAALGRLGRSPAERESGSFARRVVDDSVRRQAFHARHGFPRAGGGRRQLASPRAWRFVSARPRACAAPFLAVASLAAVRYAYRLGRDFVHEQVHSR